MRTWFDCAQVPPKGQTALIVDDSTTGGTMVIETAEHLRQYGYQVHTCLVIFTPMNSGAQDKLKSMDIQLVSAIKTHNNKQTDRDTCELS